MAKFSVIPRFNKAAVTAHNAAGRVMRTELFGPPYKHATWFIVPYRTKIGSTGLRNARYCAMHDFSKAIRDDGGSWSETEILGNHAVVKIYGAYDVIPFIAAVPEFVRLPVDAIGTGMGTATAAQRAIVRNKLLSLGYSEAEVSAGLTSDLSGNTLQQVLEFAATRRVKPRWDGSAIVFDGATQSCVPVTTVDARVPN